RSSVPDQRIRITVQARKVRTVRPSVLDELELPADVLVEAKEQDATVAGRPVARQDLIGIERLGERFSVGAAAANDAVPLVDGEGILGAGIGRERVPRVGAADVRADRAFQPSAVRGLIAERVCLRELGAVPLWSLDQRRATGPATDHLGGELEPGIRVRRAVPVARRRIDEAPESSNVLSQLAKHQITAFTADVPLIGAA